MKIIDKENKLIYECDLTGADLLHYWAGEIGLEVITAKFRNPEPPFEDIYYLTTASGSCILDWCLSYNKLDTDTNRVIELAARKYDYIWRGFQVRPYEVIDPDTVKFTEL